MNNRDPIIQLPLPIIIIFFFAILSFFFFIYVCFVYPLKTATVFNIYSYKFNNFFVFNYTDCTLEYARFNNNNNNNNNNLYFLR